MNTWPHSSGPFLIPAVISLIGSLTARLTVTLFVSDKNINLDLTEMAALHKQENPVVEHHMTCLPLHWTFLLSLTFPSLIFYQTLMFHHMLTMPNFFSTATTESSPIPALCLYSSTRNIYRYSFWPYALFLTPPSKCSANILLLSWNIAVWSHSLSVHQLLRKICAWSKGTNWPKSDWCLWYCSEEKVIPTRKSRKAWQHLAELHQNFPLLSAEEVHRILSLEENIFQLNIYFEK